MKITIFTDYFPPERNAPANRIYNFAKLWVRNGHNVTVITSFPNSPNGNLFGGYKKPAVYKRERLDGIVVKRVWSYMAPNSGFIRRSLDHLSYAVAGTVCGLFQKKQDLIIATSPQFFTGFCGLIVANIRRSKWIFEVRDLWPEGMIIINRETLIYKFLERCEKYLYRKSDKVVVVTRSYKKNIEQRCGIPSNKIDIVYNGSSYVFDARPKKPNNVKEQLVIGYAGTLGVSQGFEFLIDQIHSLKNMPYKFVIVGNGAKRDFLLQKKIELDLFNLDILDPVMREEAGKIIQTFDVGLVPLRRFEPYKKTIPSKIFDLSANRVPVLLGVDGESADLINRYTAGEIYLPESATSFVAALERIYTKLCHNQNSYLDGLKRLSQDFTHEKLANDYEKIWSSM